MLAYRLRQYQATVYQDLLALLVRWEELTVWCPWMLCRNLGFRHRIMRLSLGARRAARFQLSPVREPTGFTERHLTICVTMSLTRTTGSQIMQVNRNPK